MGTRPVRRPRRTRRALGAVASVAAALAAACGTWSGAGPGCAVVGGPNPLPEEVGESSGVAASRAHPGVYWTHNDSGDPHLYALDGDGRIRGRVRLTAPGLDTRDWEDLALGPCADGGECLYVGNVGNNDSVRDTVWIYRVPEPDPADLPESAEVEVFPLTWPGEPPDVEALFVTPSGGVFLVSKGRNSPVSLYRYPQPLRRDTAVEVEEVLGLSGPRALPRQVTGASAAPAGDLVALRTYETLSFHRFDGSSLDSLEGGQVNLRSVREAQGEAVSIGADGIVALTSEAGPLGGRSSITVLRCRLERFD